MSASSDRSTMKSVRPIRPISGKGKRALLPKAPHSARQVPGLAARPCRISVQGRRRRSGPPAPRAGGVGEPQDRIARAVGPWAVRCVVCGVAGRGGRGRAGRLAGGGGIRGGRCRGLGRRGSSLRPRAFCRRRSRGCLPAGGRRRWRNPPPRPAPASGPGQPHRDHRRRPRRLEPPARKTGRRAQARHLLFHAAKPGLAPDRLPAPPRPAPPMTA